MSPTMAKAQLMTSIQSVANMEEDGRTVTKVKKTYKHRQFIHFKVYIIFTQHRQRSTLFQCHVTETDQSRWSKGEYSYSYYYFNIFVVYSGTEVDFENLQNFLEFLMISSTL